MAGIPGCILIALSVIRCVFNPLHYPQDITTVSTTKIVIVSQNEVLLNELSYDSASWPLLREVKWNGGNYLCGVGQCLKEKRTDFLSGRPVYFQTTEIPRDSAPPTAVKGLILIKTTKTFLKKTYIQQSVDITKTKTVTTPRITHPHRPSPPVKMIPIPPKSNAPLKPAVSTIESTAVEIKEEYSSTSFTYLEGSSKTFKEILMSFKKDIEELIMAACGTVFSAGTVLFVLKIIYKHRKKLFCYRNEIAADIMEGGLQLLNNTGLDVSVQTETSLILSDNGENEDLMSDGEIGGEQEEPEREGAVGGVTGVKIAALEQGESLEQGETHPTAEKKPSTPPLSPVHHSTPVKDPQKEGTRKSLRIPKEKRCEMCV